MVDRKTCTQFTSRRCGSQITVESLIMSYQITLRSPGLKQFGRFTASHHAHTRANLGSYVFFWCARKVAWCNGTIEAAQSLSEHASKNDDTAAHLVGEEADVLFRPTAVGGTTENVSDIRELAQEVGAGKAVRLFDITVEHREVERSRRGAIVLHAIVYHGAEQAEEEEEEEVCACFCAAILSSSLLSLLIGGAPRRQIRATSHIRSMGCRHLSSPAGTSHLETLALILTLTLPLTPLALTLALISDVFLLAWFCLIEDSP